MMVTEKEAAEGLNMRTATQHRFDFRRSRSQQMLAAVMNELGDLIPHQNRKDAYNKLFDLFMTEGVDIITDQDRRDAGLQPRDEFGTTPGELAVMELHKLDAMLKPISIHQRMRKLDR